MRKVPSCRRCWYGMLEHQTDLGEVRLRGGVVEAD